MADRKDGPRGYAIVSNMENNVRTIKDLARLLTMAVESSNSIQEEQAAALQRLGWVIEEYADYIEADRCEALEALAGYRSLPPGASL